MDAIECLKTRRSNRKFSGGSVPREVIEDIVDCGRLAATGINIQPWHFVVVQEESTRRKIADITTHGKFIADAPVCVIVFCDDVKYFLEDGSAATQNIMNAAHAHGLGSCWVAGDKKPYAEEIRQLLGVPEGIKLISLIAIGPTDETPTPAKKSLQQVLHWDRF